MNDRLIVRGAREHNLKNVSLDMPRNSLIVFTGLSGSGKSSLAFDTIFAEGQRRYVESLSAYARQFLGQMDKPDVDFTEAPAIHCSLSHQSWNQKSKGCRPRTGYGLHRERYSMVQSPYPLCRANPECRSYRTKPEKYRSRINIHEIALRSTWHF